MDFPHDTARAVITDLVGRRHRDFTAYKDIEADDLISHCMTECLKAWPTFDASRGAASTLIVTISNRRLTDLLRSRSKSRERDRQIAARTGSSVPPAELWLNEYDPDQPLDEWLAGVYAAARQLYRGQAYFRRGRKHYSIAQYVAIGALMVRLKLTARACRELLVEREDLRKAVKMWGRASRVPSHQTIWRGACAMREFQASNEVPPMLEQEILV